MQDKQIADESFIVVDNLCKLTESLYQIKEQKINVDACQESQWTKLSLQIRFLKKKFKPLAFYLNQQMKKKKIISRNHQIQFDQNTDFFLEQDADTMKIYSKQYFDNMFTVDRDQINLLQKEGNNKKEEAQQADSKLTNKYMLKQAMLKEKNMDIIKKLEIDYFQDCYGNYFNIFHQVEVQPILRFESHLLYNFERALRYRSFDSDMLIQMILYLEQQISNTILNKGSICKFIFQDSKDNWFCLSHKFSDVEPCLLDIGPWNFYDECFRSGG